MLTEKEVRAIKKKAMKGDVEDLASYLKSMLGSRLTAYLSGRSDANILDSWISGKEKPIKIEELRLRYGYWAARLVVEVFDAETAKSLFLGTNGGLNDEAPASWLRDHEKEEDLKEVVGAIQSFLDGGFH